jgi:hypothetical protein
MNELSTSPQSDAKLTRVFSRTPSSWDPQDDLLLKHLKEEQKLGWKEISSHFAHRTPNACQFRWRRLRSGSLKSTGDKEKSDKNDSSTSNSTPSANSLNANSISPSTSPDPVLVPSYNKFQSIPPQIKSNSTPVIKNIKPNNAHVGYNNTFTFNSKQNSGILNPGTQVVSKRRNSSKIEPTDVLAYSSSSSISSDDEDLNKPKAVPNENQWTFEEDELIVTRKQRQLTFAELSILLPSRSESDITQRIAQLEKNSKATSAIESPFKSRRDHARNINIPKKSMRSFSSSSTTIPIPAFSTIQPSQQIRASSRSRSFSSRSKSFSLLTSPYFTTAPANFQDRYYSQRKNSITNHKSSTNNIPNDRKNSIINGVATGNYIGSLLIKPRSNSMRYSLMRPEEGIMSVGANDAVIDDSYGYSSEEEEFVSYNTSNIRVEPIAGNGVVSSLGSLLNEYQV